MKKLFTLILMLTVTATTFQSCLKGDTGPAGPTGNANVQSTTLTVSNWTYDTGNNEWYDYISWPAITDDVVNNGTVQVFYGDGTTWAALPLTFYSQSTGISYNFSISDGQIKLIVLAGDDLSQSNPGTSTFKFVAIGGSARKMMKQNNIDATNYPEVKNYFKLKD